VVLLRWAFSSVVRRGTLHVTTANGSTFTVGDGCGVPVAVRFTCAAAERALLLDPELALGEIYMDGTFIIEQGSLSDLLAMIQSQTETNVPGWLKPMRFLRYCKRRLQQFNSRRRARNNVAHHYDLDGRLYSIFLDDDRQYSCAYFETPGQTLDDAQLAKKRHLAAKLVLEPGRHVLDIGCGWGGLALYLAEHCDAQVTGITLSEEQFTRARGRAAEKGLAHKVTIQLQDYRDMRQRFDRIVSVGMFEHVGVGFYDAFFRQCANVLADDGIVLLHAIGRAEGPNVTNPWIAKYIFPGGYIPALSEVLPAIERSGLLVTDIEILRLHYADTLKAWRERFLARREEVERLYDARFCRMWEFYLTSSETAFRNWQLMVFQIQLAKRHDVVPLTRDYILHEETRLRAKEGRRRTPLQLAGE
jgi:cyclopropane-fatty-acyl-phospholipid synthase